jgi:LPPG:FO 2-phospho-L-lactate transferase
MDASGLDVSATGVAQAYRAWLDVLVLDDLDAPRAADVEALGVKAVAAPIIMTGPESEIALARRVLDAIRNPR